MKDIDPESERAVQLTVARFRRKVWWADEHELLQVGRLAVLEAQRTYEEGVGRGGFMPYALRAVGLAITRHLWNMSAPVSGGKHRPRQSLNGVVRAPVEAAEESPHPERPDSLVEDAYWRARVRARLRALAPAGDVGDAAVQVTLQESTPPEAAEDWEEAEADVRRTSSRLRAAAAQDAALYNSLRELLGEDDEA